MSPQLPNNVDNEPHTEPVLRILAASLHGQTTAIVGELQAMRHDLRWVFAVLLVALVLMAGLVGVGVTGRVGGAQVTTHTAHP